MARTYRRGDLYYADLNQCVGSEQEGNRPVVIIQNDIGNKHSPTVIVAAITSQNPSKGVLPTHCYLGAESGLERPSIILLEQLRTIDKRRLGHYIGRLSQKRIEEMDRALMVSLDLFCQESKTTIISLCGVCVSNFRNTGAYYLCRLDPGQIKKEVKPLGDMYMSDVTSDDIRVALIPASQKSASVYNKVNMLFKCIFYSAERSELLDYNPSASISAKGGTPAKDKDALTDEQVKVLLDTVRELPPYLFIMIGLYSGLRREEILGLQWDCVFLDTRTPYIAVRRAWRTEHNRPVVSTVLKTPAAQRDIPIPKCLVDCLLETKKSSISDYVIADSKGEPLAYSQFQRLWKYVTVRSTKERTCYKVINGQRIKYTKKPALGTHQKNNPSIVYTMDFEVTPHQLRHTYITNLLYAGVDPKTVQYLAGHENSKTTMDIYAKVKYNRPEELIGVVNRALT